MKPESLCFHKAQGANDHVKQSDAFFFARNPIGVTDNQFPTMLTNTIHILTPRGKEYAITDCLTNVQTRHAIERSGHQKCLIIKGFS